MEWGIFIRERTNNATFKRRVRCRERECAKAVFPAARAGGIQMWVRHVCAYIYIYIPRPRYLPAVDDPPSRVSPRSPRGSSPPSR